MPYANNARTHSDEQVAQIAASIAAFGFVNPVLVDERGVIIAGHGRLAAARMLGMTTVPVIELAHLTVQGYFSTWPTPIYDFWDMFGQHEVEKRWRPTPRQISQMEYVCEWLRAVPVRDSKIIWRRASGVPWKVIITAGYSRCAARNPSLPLKETA